MTLEGFTGSRRVEPDRYAIEGTYGADVATAVGVAPPTERLLLGMYPAAFIRPVAPPLLPSAADENDKNNKVPLPSHPFAPLNRRLIEVTMNTRRAQAQKTATPFRMECAITATIGATPETIWALLTDAAASPRWNSTVTRIEGDIAERGLS